MLLTTALIKSLHGIATRRVVLRKTSKGNLQFDHHFAVVSDKGVVHVLRGHTGTIRRIEAVDQLRTDWEPFQEVPENKRTFKKAQLKKPERTVELVEEGAKRGKL